MKADKGFLNEIKGTGKVFSFTLEETFKRKINLVTLGIIFLLALFALPLGSLMLGDDSYLSDADTDTANVADNESDNNGSLTDAQLDYLKTQGISDVVIQALKKEPEITSWENTEEYEKYLSWVEEDASSETDDGEDLSMQTMTVQLVYAVFVMMLCLLATSYIIRTVLEEKTSKLMDLLMVSVKPMALLLGKILAMLIYVLIMLFLMVAGVFASYMIFSNMVDIAYLEAVDIEGFGSSLGFLTDFLAFAISVILGYIGFGFLAGVLAAGCRDTEESASAMQVPMLLVMGGYFISLITSMSANAVLQTILSMIPVLNMYVAPVQFIMGHVGLPVLLLSWAVQILWALLGIWLASRVYAGLIIYNGKQIKFFQILRMAFKGVA